MGGPAKKVKKAFGNKVEKIPEPKFKTPEEGKKKSAVLKDKLEMEDEEFQKKYADQLNKRKGKRSTIMTSASGLNEDAEIKKRSLLG
nr:hypothetical protein [uncultured Mediterranean phage uvMED]